MPEEDNNQSIIEGYLTGINNVGKGNVDKFTGEFISDHHRRQEIINKLNKVKMDADLDAEKGIIDSDLKAQILVHGMKRLGESIGEQHVKDALTGKHEGVSRSMQSLAGLLDIAFPPEDSE